VTGIVRASHVITHCLLTRRDSRT